MVSEIDIYRTAKSVIGSHNEGAPRECLRRSEHFRTKGDRGGAAVWLRVKRAAEEILNTEPPGPLS